MTVLPTILRASNHRRMRWANGGGWTTEIIAWPKIEKWEWRVTVADVKRSGPFSVFPEVDRTIALLRGAGFTLTIADQMSTTISRTYDPFSFSGDEQTACVLVDGPVQDLNLMVRRSSRPRRISFVELGSGRSDIDITDMELAVVVSGEVRFDSQRLLHLDAVRPTPGGPLLFVETGEVATVALVV
jgi:uncharacterized protein